MISDPLGERTIYQILVDLRGRTTNIILKFNDNSKGVCNNRTINDGIPFNEGLSSDSSVVLDVGALGAKVGAGWVWLHDTRRAWAPWRWGGPYASSFVQKAI